jgi:uncharacterized protein YndB with AHSA1/START domain
MRTAISLATVLLLPSAAVAELGRSAPDNVLIEHHYSLSAAPAVAWQALVHPERWWPEDHTWSGARANLELVPSAGGCFCERWAGGSAEHARVLMALDGQLLRLRGSFGPLQEMGVTGILTVTLTPNEQGTEARVTYRISGDASHQLDQFAAVVDKVIGQQFGEFARHAGVVARAPDK